MSVIARIHRDAKRAAGDAIVLVRYGEMFRAVGADADAVSRICGIRLALEQDRDNMIAAFPACSLDDRLAELVAGGQRVAIVDYAKAATAVVTEQNEGG